MPVISLRQLQAHREETFRLRPEARLHSAQDALEFVNQRGFVFFWPNQGTILPSIWNATVGDRPVPDNHDDPGHVTWGWKDDLLDKRVWFYGRVIRRRNAMIALNLLPSFYALSPNYGDPEHDYLDQYQQGVMTFEAKSIYEALLHEGPLDTLSLRRAARLSSETSSARFSRSLDDLQKEFKILPVGVSRVGGWNYAFIYDIVPRYHPELQEQARYISELEAQQTLAAVYLHSVGALRARDLVHLFRWSPADAARALQRLAATDPELIACSHPTEKGEWLALPALVE
ncbi:hypothetical protein ADN00_08080 [Ornatilinea apprima]|uniref:Winged helix DNA-binding domain-containing protein n=1 Tax=Ornatilinea apprima TaxID=1134406 RepID=A0A0P6XRE2_9CHLR|nr:crosslink repair DNA glycosylase YcaQ family protein [Ornatilinea apprima]KPL77833.1 hypothetical protein ADN00_08080 [Ornatilinea apprima]